MVRGDEFQVGEWRVHPHLNRIERGSEIRHLEPRVMDLLAFFASHAGEVVSKDQLIEAVWPVSFVTDAALTTSIGQLRRQLGDDAKHSRYVETIPLRGYRLVAKVTFSTQPAPAASGTRYVLLEKLGEGVRGTVYLARDEILRRQVALKFPRPELEQDRIARSRFLKEARAAASLNHPHICAVYGTGKLDGRSYIAMEYAQGQTLRQCLGRGPIPVDEALRIGIQMAEALEAAHRAGIIHREINATNIILTSEGQIKITDFGIAKLLKSESESSGSTPTLVQSFVALDTLPYTSPEQLQETALDARTDLFSFGVVAYEMVTGKLPWTVASTGATVEDILHGVPPLASRINPDVPDRFAAIIARCLEKNHDLRYASAGQLLAELKRVREDGRKVDIDRTGERDEGHRVRRISWVSGLAVLTAVALLSTSMLWDSLWDRHSASSEPLRMTPFTTEGGWKARPRFSPDGERVAYDWDGPEGDNRDVYVKALGTGSEPLRLTKFPGPDFGPAWSPDGREIAFTRASDQRRASIYVVPSMGGPVRKVVDFEGPLLLRDLGLYYLGVVTWSPDGESLVFAESETEEGPARLVQIALATLEKRVLTEPPLATLGDLHPQFSPDGGQIAFLRAGSSSFGRLDVWLLSLKDKTVYRLTDLEFDQGERPSWSPDGDWIFFHSQPVYRASQPLQVHIGSRVIHAVPGLGLRTGIISSAGDRLVFEQRTSHPFDIVRLPLWTDTEPEPIRVIGSSFSDFDPDISSDEREIVFCSQRSGSPSIWKCGQGGSGPIQLTYFDEHCGGPRWSPDGRSIAFHALHSGNWDLWTMDRDGGRPEQLTTASSDEDSCAWSRDGEWIYFRSSRGGTSQIYRMPARGGEAVQVTENGGYTAMESPDGRYLYFDKCWAPGPLFRVPSSGPGEEETIVPRVERRQWAVGRRGIYFAESGAQEYCIRLLDLETGELRDLYRSDGSLQYDGLTVAPSEDCLLFSQRPAGHSELVLAEKIR